MAAFALLDGPGLGERRGPPVEAIAVERTRLEPGVIEMTVRNDGPDPVRIAQVIVNDAFASFEGGERPDRHRDQEQRDQPQRPGRKTSAAKRPRLHQSRTSKKPCHPSSVNSDWCAWNMNRPACGNFSSRIPRCPWHSITVSVSSLGAFEVPVGK